MLVGLDPALSYITPPIGQPGACDYTGQDGLTIRDVPQLKTSGDEATFQTIPTSVVVRPSLSKARHQYFTFLSEEACGYLKDYLEDWARNGEKLGPDSRAWRAFIFVG